MSEVVGLDQSYTGFGHCNVNGSASKKGFPLSKFPDADQRLFSIELWLREWIRAQRYPLHLVVMEGYAPGSKFGREVAGELGWAVRRTIREASPNAQVLIVPPSTLKKFVTGKGNAKKNEMLLGVYKQWGNSYADDNEADSHALWQFGKAYLGEPTKPLTQYQEQAIEAVRKAK